MRTIYRFEFLANDRVTINMPRGARILSVLPSDRLDYGIAMWALVDTAQPSEPRHLLVFGTGHPLLQGLARFLGTVSHGNLVWHVFEPAPIVGSDPGPPHDSDGPE